MDRIKFLELRIKEKKQSANECMDLMIRFEGVLQALCQKQTIEPEFEKSYAFELGTVCDGYLSNMREIKSMEQELTELKKGE